MSNDVAIVGLSGRFPGAENINEFWDIIREGRETISYYSKEELLAKGVNPELLNNPSYVLADSIIESGDKFDSSFFGYTPREADFMDPQHRVLLEECYSALENAGYDPDKFAGEIGVFAGCSNNRYLLKNLAQHPEVLNSLGELQTIVNNDKDFLTTRVSYKLNLKGPSVNIQTACSTSLVAIHFACQSLITNQCDMALGGGVFIKTPRGEGYIFEEGNIDSPTGHCLPFDKDANGTIFGEGVGVVVLKRLEDAVCDHDSILAVIKATAINNDGSLKVGYMAPGVSGQAKVISKAFDLAGIDPDTVSFIETHGTGTKMGDPIEVEALRRVFSSKSQRMNFCALSSVKANIGHLDAAAGVTGLIKTALVLKNRQLPPLINFTTPNPELELEDSPFYITRELKNWDAGDFPRRAAVSSFGIGGTNSHAILEEWIPKPSEPSSKRFHLLPISAKSDSALQIMHENIISHLNKATDNIADIAFTLQNGRKEFKNRGILVWDNSDGNNLLFSDFPYFEGKQKFFDPKTVFMFTGQGSQYIKMAKGLYEHFESVKTIMDYADSLLNEYNSLSLLEILFADNEENQEIINKTSFAQPALFVVQFAIANLLKEFGVMPDALIGHSIGEITAACLSGVFSFEDALKLVAWRGKLMQEQMPGGMLSINLPKSQVRSLLTDDVELALNNAPNFCVVSGSFEAIDVFQKKVLIDYPYCRVARLKTSHAFHSRSMEPAIEPFLKVLDDIEFGKVDIPFISNVTGTWITNKEAISSKYWATHIRSMVNFSEGITELISDENTVFIEVGPGNSLSLLLSQFPVKSVLNSFSTMRHPRQPANDVEFFFKTITSFWLSGGTINWESIYADEIRYRVPLPTYPFERIKHWIDPKIQYNSHISSLSAQLQKNQPPGYEPGNVISTDPIGLYHKRPLLDNEFIAAESKLEKRIAIIWEELLGINGIGITDDFFYLGGHSLLASQILNRINEEFNSGITIEKFFKFSTIKRLIENVEFEDGVVESVHISSIQDYSSSLPLSPGQERLWIINQIDNNTPAYNISFSYIFEGNLNKKIFQESLEILFERHNILKSYIRTVDSRPVAYINHDAKIHILEIDFSEFSAIESDIKIQEFIENESRTRFVIENGPLYRISLLNLGEEKTLFHFTVHHLIFDGWSWGIFTKELTEIYNDLLSGKEIKLDPLSYNYFEYAKMANQEDQDIKHKASKEFWKNKLNGITGQLNFPLDYKRKEISTGEGGRVALYIGKERVEKLRVYSQKENVTLNMFFISVFGFLLSRYSGDHDLCIGSPTANRPGTKLEKLIGLFINSIVLRLQINEELCFSDLLKKVKNISIEALSNQDLPFENLVDLLQPERIMNMNPIFQVMFAWQNAPRPPLDLDGIHPDRVFQKNGVSPLDITFYAWEENGSVFGEIEFCTDILKRSTIDSLKENFIYLFDQIIANPGIPLKNISIISDYEKERIAEFNNTDVDIPDVSVNGLFEQIVKVFSDKIAVENISGGGSLTYSELEKQANRFAHYLFQKGFTKGGIAGISMTRSEYMIVAVLAILKAGGTYLPLDPAFPDDRLFYMLEDSGAKLLITEESFTDRFRNIDVVKIAYDTEQSKISKESSLDLKIDIDLDSIAYIIYTSGSTGKPKGVKVHHQAVVNFINSMSKVPGLSSEDRLLSVTTLSFDISVLELFLPLSQGATVIIADNEHIADGELLGGIIEKYHISIMQATPATWTILLASGWTGNKQLKALCGGEPLQPGLARDLLEKVNTLWNMYGPTETTVWSSCKLITDHNQILVGKPIDNTQFHILYNDHEQPIGAIGELCIGGMGVSKGYHMREELTREKFFNWNGEVIYRTGDLARFLDTGEIELFGRTDNQIKLRGYRIEPGEIEFQLSQIEGVKEAVVKLEKFGELDERLIGYLNISDSFIFDRENVIKFIENRLPNYMIPSSFMIMKEFPRTLNGKIDRKSLVYNIINLPEEAEGNIEDFSEIERSLAGIWQDILRMKNIKKNQSFFDIGGNSLLAIRCINKIKEKFGCTLTFRELITNPTICLLGCLIETKKKTSDKGVELIHTTDTKKLPLTRNQKRLWLFSRLLPDVPSYIISRTTHFHGSIDREVFQKSIELLFKRHTIVYSVIKEIDGEPYCDIVHSKVKINFLDFSGLSEKEREDKVYYIINKDTGEAFSLEKAPLYRMYLIMLSNSEYVFHISIHHIIFDGWSWSVFVKDLNEIYNSLKGGREISLAKIEFQQYDFALWEIEHIDSQYNNETTEFWRENLNGATSILDFPYDFQVKDNPSGKGSYVPIQIPRDMSDKLRLLSKTQGSSLFTTLLSAFGIQIYKYSGENDLNIGIPVAYRPLSALENIFGMFVNTVVVRLRYSKDATFRTIIQETNDAALNAIAHQELPFENVVEMVNPERSSNANPLFQISFVWQNNLDLPILLDGIKSKKIIGKDRTAAFNISFYAWENGEIIEGEIEYSTDLFRHDTILRMKENLMSLIGKLVENPDMPIDSLSIISEEERLFIDRINDTKTDYPKEKSIVELFEDQVSLYPDKLAVVFKGSSLTYNELNERANQLAGTLRKLGVRIDTPVGVYVDKSLEMIVGILGILKSGGAYLPIDPDYPVQRVDFIIKESGCNVLLTQGKYMDISFPGVTKLDLNSPVTYQREKSDIERINSSTDLAYFMYTSGTTGVPKGSMIRHYSVIRTVRNVNYMEMTSEDRILYTSAIVFDVTTYEIWGALLNGMTLYVVDKETILDATALGKELAVNEITILHLTSALFTQLAESRTDIFSGLRYLLIGGDVLSAPHINKVRKDNPGLKVINCYGPSENTTYSTTYLIDKTHEINIPIGKPISNSTVYIFDKHMNYQPIGVMGEIYVGGDGLSKGYLNREDLNSRSFIEHPYISGERLYKTGDFGRWLSDGNIEFQGRVDNQIKIRGFRVELEEIESVISKIEGVIESVIKPVKVEEGDYRLVAFLNVPETFKTEWKEISRQLKERLPSYMVPTAYRFLHGFPKTINGKTDKKALTIEKSELENTDVRERGELTATEKEIYRIWSDALKTSDITTADNFFDIGGTSLLAISVFTKIEKAFKVEMGLRVFFDSPRIMDLAEYIDLTIQKTILKKRQSKVVTSNTKIANGEI